MGTNFYRIPKSKEMIERHQRLHDRITRLDWISPSDIHTEYRNIQDPTSESEWDMLNPWEEFLLDANIHLGKRSSGWKFIWNWNKGKHYTTKEELFKFIRSGRVVDEYGRQMDVEEFITMALEWGQEDGWDADTYYKEHPTHNIFPGSKHEEYIDGLRVSTSDNFS